MKPPKSDFIGSDIFGLIILATLCFNRALLAFFKDTHEDVLVYKYNLSVTSSHWIEALIPLKAWVGIWTALAILCIASIPWRRARPVIFGMLILFVIVWGTSQIFSPQITSSITGFFWINLSLILMWGQSRISPRRVEQLYSHEGHKPQEEGDLPF